MYKLKTLFLAMIIAVAVGCTVFAEPAELMLSNIDLEENGIGTWEDQEENNRYVLELYKD